MAPKKGDALTGRAVLAPRELWPGLSLPKGQRGWEGEVPRASPTTKRAARRLLATAVPRLCIRGRS